jgi:hypothetical protein
MRGCLACAIGSVAVLVAATGCSSGSAKNGNNPGLPKTVTVTAPSSTPGSSSSSASTSASPSPALVRKLPGTCDSLLPTIDVESALGSQLHGKTAFVVGTAEKNIGRLGYINCRYALGPGAKPSIEIGVSLYNSAAQARRRATGTISDYRDHGATTTATVVSGTPATILVGGSGSGYTVPLIVLASGQRTVAVGVIPTMLPAAKRQTILTKLAELAAERTGG